MARPDIASQSAFAALMDDEDTVGTSGSDSEQLPYAASSAAATTPSKKARARKRAADKKRAVESGAETGPEGAVSRAVTPARTTHKATTEKVPPVPDLPLEQQNGLAMVLEASKASMVEIAADVKAPIAHIVDSVLPSTPLPPALVVSESVSSSDAETEPTGDFLSDPSDDEDPEPSPSPSPAPIASSLSLPATPPTPDASVVARTSTGALPSPPTEVYTGADHDPKKKLTAIITRTVYGILMAGGLISIVCLGQIYVIVLVFICQAVVFSELTGLFDAGYSNGTHADELAAVEEHSEREKLREVRRKGRRAERDRWSRRISWYFFATTNYFLYGESLIYYFKHILTLQSTFLPATFSFAQHHRLISFGLYVIGFVSFVANLQRAQLRRQFGLFGWIHMSLLLVVVSSHFIVNNILEGLIWFWVPASLVITNDIAAYVCGMAFGRHQLIKLSPKKTVEGFVGAFFVTIVFAYLWGTFFMKFDYMICPVQDLATNVLSDMTCVPNPVFTWREFPLPDWATSFLLTTTRQTITQIPWAPFQLHSIVLAIFASLVAPFGGFFASGFKRAFNIKDFGASIPGHGGLTDRMDCQFLMGLFSYVWYASLIRTSHITVSSVLATIVSALSTEEQLELLKDLSQVLAKKGLQAASPW